MRVCFSLWVPHKGLWNGEEEIWTLVMFGGWLEASQDSESWSSRTLPAEIRGKHKFPLSFRLIRIQLFWGFLRKFYFKILLGGRSLFKLKCEDVFSFLTESSFISSLHALIFLPSVELYLLFYLEGRIHAVLHFKGNSQAIFPNIPPVSLSKNLVIIIMVGPLLSVD